MKHIIEYSEVEFFKENGFLEIENLCSPEEILPIEKEIQTFCKNKKLTFSEAKKLFLQTHDLYRLAPSLKKLLTSKEVASAIFYLTKQKTFRLLFDQYLFHTPEELYPSPFSIETLSFQGLLLGGLLKLSGSEEAESSIFPKKAGNIVFFQPKMNLDLSFLKTTSGSEYLLFAFGLKQAIYRLSPSDPHTHLLKTLGYAFGDHLTNELHPIIFAKT